MQHFDAYRTSPNFAEFDFREGLMASNILSRTTLFSSIAQAGGEFWPRGIGIPSEGL